LSAGPPRLHLYRIHGLLVESEIPLQARRVDRDGDGGGAYPEPENEAEPVPDYRVVEGEPRDCPHSPPRGRILAELRDDAFGYWAAESRRDPAPRWTLRYAGICDVTLDCERKTITVHRAPEVDPGLIPVFLGGSVLAHALTAQGLLVLHGSAVEIGGRALAIVGPSGAGKSTLAALLCAAGARLVADDALRVDATDSGAVCFPGTTGLRLRPAAASLGDGIEGAAVSETADGRTAVLPARPADTPLMLGAVLVPEPSREASKLEVRRLGAMEGLQELLRHPRLTMWRASEPIGQLFERTGEIAEAVPLYRGSVPWGPPFPSGLAEELLEGVGLGATSGREGTQHRDAVAPDPQVEA
jgi:hypothetical protein